MFFTSHLFFLHIILFKNKTVICHLSLTSNILFIIMLIIVLTNTESRSHRVFLFLSVSSYNLIYPPCLCVSVLKYKYQIRVTCFTPFTALSFLIRASSRDVSSMLTTRFPLKSPSLLSILILRNVSFSSLLMILVRLFTMPMSSLPTTRSVIEYIDVPLPLHLALTMR